MMRSFLVFAFLTGTIAAPVSAEPIPLLEMKWQILAPEFPPMPATAEFSFAGGVQFSFSFHWVDQYSPSDAGRSFWAPIEVVEGANRALNAPDAVYELINGPANFANFSSLELEQQEPSSEPPCPGRNSRCADLAVYVADLGSYRVTAVERNIDYLSLPAAPMVDNWIFEGSQTIRYWGALIPEPGSAILLSMAVAHLCFSRQPRRQS